MRANDLWLIVGYNMYHPSQGANLKTATFKFVDVDLTEVFINVPWTTDISHTSLINDWTDSALRDLRKSVRAPQFVPFLALSYFKYQTERQLRGDDWIAFSLHGQVTIHSIPDRYA